MRLSNKSACFWLVCMLSVLLYLASQVVYKRDSLIETNVLALLPDNQQDPFADIAFNKVAGSLSEKVIFAIGAQDKQQVIAATQSFSDKLAQLSLFETVTATYSQSEQQELARLYFPKRAQLLTDAQRVRLSESPETQITTVLQALYNPFSGVTGQELESDPFLLFREYLSQQARSQGKTTLEDGYLTASYQGKVYSLIFAELSGSPYSVELQQQLGTLEHHEAQTRQDFDVELLHTGVIFYAAYGTQSAKGEISTIGLGSLIGVILLIIVVFRSVLPLGLALLSIGCGVVAGFTLTLAVFGQVHLFSMVIGASLIGVSIDYSLHFLTERLAAGRQWQAKAGLKNIFIAISLGLAMSLLGYLCMLITPFPGLQQLSLFSATGLAAAYATVVCWYPILAASQSKTERLPLATTMKYWLKGWHHSSVRIAVPVCFILISLFGMYSLQFDDDIRQLQTMPAELQQQEAKIKQISGVNAGQQMLLVKAKDQQALLEALEGLAKDLDSSVSQGILSGYSSIHQYVPSLKSQTEDYQLVSRLYQEYGASLAQQLNMGTSPADIEAFTPLNVADFLATSMGEQLGFMWLGSERGQHAAVVLLKDVGAPEQVRELANHYPQVSYLDKASEVSETFFIYRHKITELLFFAILCITVLLRLRYPSAKTIKILLPPVIACLVGLSASVFLTDALNIFSLLGLFLVLGIGIDYTLFFAEHTQPTRTLLAISLSALTTILSFGLLSLSQTQAIASFGTTVLAGIVTAWLLAPLALDVAVSKRINKKEGELDACNG